MASDSTPITALGLGCVDNPGKRKGSERLKEIMEEEEEDIEPIGRKRKEKFGDGKRIKFILTEIFDFKELLVFSILISLSQFFIKDEKISGLVGSEDLGRIILIILVYITSKFLVGSGLIDKI